MKLERFRVQEIDKFGGRIAHVKTSKAEFQCPSRAATSTEYNYKRDLRIDEAFENDVGEYVARFNSEDIARFANRNGSYESRLRAASSYGDQMAFVVSKSFPQCPGDHSFDEETVRLMVEFQVESGLDMISIPPSADRHRDLVRYFARWTNHAERYAQRLGKEIVPIPYVPMNLREELFRGTVQKLWDERSRYPVIGLIYASIRENKINYSFLRRNRDQDSWLHMSGIPRVGPSRGRWALAQMHIPQVYGIDTVSASVPWGGGGIDPPTDYRRFRYFDRSTLGLPRIEEWIQNHKSQNPECPCPICQEEPFPNIVRRFIAGRLRDLDLGPLFGVFRLHEVFQSTDSFEESREYISENRFADYLTERIGGGVEDLRDRTGGTLEDFAP